MILLNYCLAIYICNRKIIFKVVGVINLQRQALLVNY